MIESAQSEPGISIKPDALDTNHWLLNCENGTLDLKTGKLLPHDRDNLITKIVPFAYDPDATAPIFKSFLDRIMDGNQNLIQFMQRAIGYSLTGDISEQCLFFLYGTGANGKSTLLEVIRHLLNDYAMQTGFDTFLSRQNTTVRNDLARLKGTRFVTAVEVEANKALSEVMVKQITGGDPLTARFLYGEYFEFYPHFKVFLAGNHKPPIRGGDEGIWRRIHLVPFTVTIPKEERDVKLMDKLFQELPGILTWAVEGSLQWQQTGLNAPEEVKEATEEYKEDMDVLADFLSERCKIEPFGYIKTKELYSAYQQYCSDNNENPYGKQKFRGMLEERGFTRDKKGGALIWQGIQLKPEEDALVRVSADTTESKPVFPWDAFRN